MNETPFSTKEGKFTECVAVREHEIDMIRDPPELKCDGCEDLHYWGVLDRVSL